MAKKILFVGSPNHLNYTDKQKKAMEYRKEARRLVSLANKRVRRLEEKGLTDTPAYQGFIKEGESRFSVKGKSFNELQKEVARMRNFINANTSTIKGLNTYLKDMASNTGIKYKNMDDLYKKAPKFFELSSKVEQYLRTVDNMASAIGYQKIWQSINQYVKETNTNLSDAETNIDNMVEKITEAIKEQRTIKFDIDLDGDDGWFKLD